MARYQKQRINYPIGSISSGTMNPDDLIPTFCSELESLAKQSGIVPARQRKAHLKLVRDITSRMDGESYHDSKMTFAGLSGEESFADDDLDALFDALGEYAGPYFYFGAHPGDGADYGFWLSESWDEDFYDAPCWGLEKSRKQQPSSIKVEDLPDVPSWFRGEVAVVNDHGNVTLYRKTSRALHEIWSIV